MAQSISNSTIPAVLNEVSRHNALSATTSQTISVATPHHRAEQQPGSASAEIVTFVPSQAVDQLMRGTTAEEIEAERKRKYWASLIDSDQESEESSTGSQAYSTGSHTPDLDFTPLTDDEVSPLQPHSSCSTTLADQVSPPANASASRASSRTLGSDEGGNADEMITNQVPSSSRKNWDEYSHMVDLESPCDLPEEDTFTEKSIGGPQGHTESYRMFLKMPTEPLGDSKPFYTPDGPWSFSDGCDLENVQVIKLLGEGAFARVYLKRATLARREITFISKEWDIKRNSEGFLTELALFTSPKYLRDLQGICVPRLLGIFKKNDFVTFAFELPHANSWMEAHPGLPLAIKNRIVDAYRQLHAKGILHDDVETRHMLVSDDGRITIIDFNLSRVLKGNEPLGLAPCSLSELRLEKIQVTVMLRYPGAVEKMLLEIDQQRWRLIQKQTEIKRIRMELAADKRWREKVRSRNRRKRRHDEMDEDSSDEDPDILLERELRLPDRVPMEEYLEKWLSDPERSRRFIIPGGHCNPKSLPDPVYPFEEPHAVKLFLESLEERDLVRTEEYQEVKARLEQKRVENDRPPYRGLAYWSAQALVSVRAFIYSFIPTAIEERPRKRTRVQ